MDVYTFSGVELMPVGSDKAFAFWSTQIRRLAWRVPVITLCYDFADLFGPPVGVGTAHPDNRSSTSSIFPFPSSTSTPPSRARARPPSFVSPSPLATV